MQQVLPGAAIYLRGSIGEPPEFLVLTTCLPGLYDETTFSSIKILEPEC